MDREVKLPPGWLAADIERASKRVAEWLSKPITQAQNERAKQK